MLRTKKIVVDLAKLDRDSLSKSIEEIEELASECMVNVEKNDDFLLSIKTRKDDFSKIDVDYAVTGEKKEGKKWEEEKGKEVGKLLALLVEIKAMRGDYQELT